MAIEKIKRKKGFTYRALITAKTPEGKSKKVSSTFKTLAEARAWETEQKNLKFKGKFTIPGKKTFKEAAEVWMTESVEVNKARNTARSAWSDLRVHLYPVIGGLQINKITEGDVDYVRVQLLNKGIQKSSVNRVMATFKALMAHCHARRMTPFNPFATYKILRTQSKEKEYWPLDDLQTFAEKAKGEPFYDLYMLAVNTGMRYGELTALTVDKVNFKSGFIRVDASGTSDSTKNNEIRFIRMNTYTREILEKICRGKEVGELLFQSSRGCPLGSGGSVSNRYFTPLQRKLGLSKIITIHGLRHTFASHFVMKGGSIFELQKLLGHRSINSTMVYAHLSPDHLKEAMEVFGLGEAELGRPGEERHQAPLHLIQ